MLEYLKFWMAKELAPLAWLLFIACVAVSAAVILYGFLIFKDWLSYLMSRNTAPAKGQKWRGGGVSLLILGIENGRVVTEHHKTGVLSIPLEGWAKFIRNKRMRLLD